MTENQNVQPQVVSLVNIVNDDQTLNWQAVEEAIRAGTFRVSVYAKHIGVAEGDLRASLVQYFGNRIGFRRGRKGGVYFVNA